MRFCAGSVLERVVLRILLAAELGGDGELRHDGLRVELVRLHLLRDLQRVCEELGVFGEERGHLVRRLEPLLSRVDEAVFLGELLLRGEAEQHVVRIVVGRVEEVDVVRGDDLDVELLPQFEHALHDGGLARVETAVVVNRRAGDVRLRGVVEHHLQIVVVAEEVLVPLRDALRLVHAVRVDGARHLAGDAGGGANQALMVLFEQVVVDARVVVEAVDVGFGDEAHEVVVAGEVLREEDQVVAAFVLVARRVVARGGDVRLAAEDGLDGRQVAVALLGAALVVERLQGEEVAVVGDRQRGHPPLARAPHERLDAALPVQQGIGGMDMKMYKLCSFFLHGTSIP